MKKRIGRILVISLVLVMTLGQSMLVKADVSQQTVNYLLALPQDQWITMALAATGRTNLDLGYLSNFNGSSVNDYSKTVLAVAAAGLNPNDYSGHNYVDSLRGYYQNNQFGSADLISDDYWAIMALRSAGATSTDDMIQGSKNFIIGHQNTDGGFSYALSTPSDTNDTASAIMALLDAGMSSSDSQLVSAVNYLHTQQNTDGGFPYTAGSESDSGSDSWIISAIYKLGGNPATWTQGQNTPLTHLQTLALSDGSYKWISSDAQGNPLMTAYVAVALANKFYPVNYYQPSGQGGQTHHLRIEGQSTTYCDADVQANTALQIIENGASVCGYTYNIQQASFGRYLSAINGESASGSSGWMYRVNWISPMDGADDYQLLPGDQVLWSFGQFGNEPLRISLSATQVQPGGTATATVEYYNETTWQPSASTTVHVGSQTFITNDSGLAILTLSNAGNQQVYAEKNNFIRSPRLNLTVGNGVSQTVNLTVNIAGGGGGQTLSFSVDPADVSFGTLRPGQQATSSLTITNTGSVNFQLEANVNGDNLFQQNTYLNGSLWDNYSENYSVNQSRSVEANLRVPASYTLTGQKQGTIVFWATRN